MATLLVKARELGDESVADMAQRTGISRSTLHRLATGTKQPSLATLWTLRDAYSVRLDALVYDDPQTMQRSSLPQRQRVLAQDRRRLRHGDRDRHAAG
ncbi:MULTISPECIES: helix-turn-helix transcriptional regulator [Streptomyces]|uniref:helix-turn-helix domain-containing protein n=1 Tax=Streptomyces TaxID=1883 RepID=UPI001E316AE6|nr:helix-turn-helix transcriptional regulator [Streptomyces barringtoniae]MCC5476477.1 helix-turn-helix domain-containing protein [Streptomyces barringtoniae]